MSRMTPASVTAPTRERKASRAAQPAEVAREEPARPTGLGQVPLIAFLAGVGLLVCAVTDALSRATLTPSPLIYWAGLLLIVLPIFYRLCSPQPSSGERLTLVCLLGMALYGVKLARDSLVYSFPDELAHAFNADRIADTHRLFSENALQPVTPDYPGLEGATSALMTLTGMTSFGAGIVVVGAARLILMIGLFLLFRRISGSARLAGLAAAIYAGNANFLLWGAQFSYQSLALPLLILVIVAIAERDAAPRSWASRWAIPIVLGTVAIVATHHVTSYLLLATILALMLARRIAGRDASRPELWPFAAVAAGMSAIWVAFVAPGTAGYLWGPLSEALASIGKTLTGQISLRELFAPDTGARSAGIGSAPAAAKAISFTAVLVLLVALPFGLRQAWRRYRRQPFALLLCAAGVGFFAALSLRFISDAWETGNRASEFLFVGLAFVTALLALRVLSPSVGRRLRLARWQARAVVTAALGLILVGGAISGWPWDSHLPKPIRADFDGRSIDSEPLGMARWVAEHLPEGRFAASVADARFLLTPGGVAALGGKSPDVEDLLIEDVLAAWQLPLLRKERLRYVVVDRRLRSIDVVRGYAFGVQPPGGPIDRVYPRAVLTKWEQLPRAARVFHSGQIAIFDLEARR
jgi:hypothetical protein